MPDMNDLQSWAQNRAGDGDGGGTDPTADEHQEQHDEPAMEPQEAMEFVATECKDAIDALKKSLGQFEDADVANELIESLQECADKADEAGKALAEASDEDEGDEDETEAQPQEQANE